MREILFRGKRVDNGEWVEGSYVEHEHAIEWAENVSDDGLTIFSEGADVIPETVGQYTGLTDENDKKIFDGDVLKTVTQDTKKERLIRVGIGEFTDSNTIKLYLGVYLKFEGHTVSGGQIKQYVKQYGESHVEIIGNIYDNPELLEVKE